MSGAHRNPYGLQTGAGWNDERVEILKRLWQDGLSGKQIAAKLGQGVTRNAVIAKLHRLGMTQRPDSVKPLRDLTSSMRVTKARPAPRPKAAKPEPRQPKVMSVSATRTYSPIPQGPALPPERDEPPGVATIETLKPHSCRWPIGDPNDESFTFCGRQKAGKAYCAEHAAIAYQPAKPQKPRSQAQLDADERRRVAMRARRAA